MKPLRIRIENIEKEARAAAKVNEHVLTLDEKMEIIEGLCKLTDDEIDKLILEHKDNSEFVAMLNELKDENSTLRNMFKNI